MKTQEEIFKGVRLAGIPMLIFNVVLFFAVISIIGFLAEIEITDSHFEKILVNTGHFLCAFLFIFNSIIWIGFMQIEPNEARVMIFFGQYKGTVKDNGFFWVNPFYAKKKLTLRSRNMDVAPIKVNDKKGNPIMIGQVLVWRVVDTYRATFDIDNTSKTNTIQQKVDNVNEKMKAYEDFVKVQSDAALRYVAGMFAYDNLENESENLTLRSGGKEINKFLETQLNERLAIAGIEIVEACINYLAYAPEIAAVMLRRQQAEAIISAREKIVDGAVGMVKHALEKLSEEKIIELDDDKKSAMVSNLLVILCSDERTQPVINAGTLYN
jgi:regulator of protease activity HflC (stomatin/prohibitin superfamily)